MLTTDLPPAVHAPPCSDGRPVKLHVSETTLATSPDCRWQVLSLSFDADAPDPSPLTPPGARTDLYNAFVFDTKAHRIIAGFLMERSASLHWLSDGRHLVVNYFAGSNADIPLVVVLEPGPQRPPIDLAALVRPDVLRRIGHTDSQVYHDYVDFIAEDRDSVTVSAQPDYVLHGEEGPGWGRCFIYRVDKATFTHASFVREVAWQGDDLPCPRHPDEK